MLNRRSLRRGAFALTAVVAAAGFTHLPSAQAQSNPQITIAVPAYFRDGTRKKFRWPSGRSGCGRRRKTS